MRPRRPRSKSLWRDHHGHLAAFHARELLDLGDRVEVALDPHQDVHPELLVRQLAPTEPHGHLDLVALADEFLHGAHLDVIIVIVDAWAKFNFLDLDYLLL